MFRTLSRFAGSLLVALAAALSVHACRSGPLVAQGIQPEFNAINPSRILAVPLFTLPDPGSPSSIDVSAFETGNVSAVIEAEVLSAFRNQPGVNGVSFGAVRQALGKSPNVWNQLDTEMRNTSLKLTSRSPEDRAALSSECLKRKNFVDFYVHCLAKQKTWINALNALSARALNADSALLTVVTSLSKNQIEGRYGIEAGIAVVLVDTNTGKLLWGRQNAKRLESSEGTARFPEWKVLFDQLLDEAFWADFPGRKPVVSAP